MKARLPTAGCNALFLMELTAEGDRTRRLADEYIQQSAPVQEKTDRNKEERNRKEMLSHFSFLRGDDDDEI